MHGTSDPARPHTNSWWKEEKENLDKKRREEQDVIGEVFPEVLEMKMKKL